MHAYGYVQYDCYSYATVNIMVTVMVITMNTVIIMVTVMVTHMGMMMDMP